MPKCDHFIYTAGKIGNNEGYQIIAKSAGITNEIISKLEKYLYPLGVKISEFKESRSLLILPNNKIAYSIIKNIGTGYDGRRGTLYNHTFVIDENEFEELNFDSRVFEKHFIKNDSVRGELKPVNINPTSGSPDFKFLKKQDSKLLEEILYRISARKKIAILKTDELMFLHNVFAILPPPLRLIPFSTLVVEPDRQDKFHLIQIPKEIETKIGKSFAIIDPEQISSSTRKRSENYEDIKQLMQFVLDEDEKSLQQIFRNFEKIPVRLSRTRRVKLEEIFVQSDFEYLSKRNNFGKLKNKVKKLYGDKKFNESSPKIIVSITKKIQKIIKKRLKEIDPNKQKNQEIFDQVTEITKIMLDSMNYLQKYSKKSISKTIEKEISHEIMKLEEILEIEYSSKTTEAPYVFDYMQYAKWQAKQFTRTVQSGIAWGLWVMGLGSKSKE